ncbi:MAG: carbohydrate-binding domain-containing protein [Tenericutes bacterium]|nr:carbohydrate-binding domain-containing protein [Mycoplasmatota bacterium]
MKNNYGIYTSYYGIYTSNKIDNILFSKVTADKEDLQDGNPYYFYKASGSISSDIDLYFAGDGYLNVTSKNKEGIETKGNLYLGDGKGDYVINAMDDCINTTTSFQAENVRNDLVINVNTLYANVLDDADEGDAIDSNGILTINAGTIYAFAHYKSGDSGLDSDKGTYINGGTIIATGNMDDRIDSSSQKTIYVTFNETIPANTLLVIKDENDKIITAFKTNKDIKTLLYTTKDLSYNSYKIYKDGVITGDSENGLYYSIDSYTDGTLVSYSNSGNFINNSNNKEDISNKLLNVLLVEISALVLILLYVFISKKREDNNKLSN